MRNLLFSARKLLLVCVLLLINTSNHPKILTGATGPCLLLDPQSPGGSVCVPVQFINQAFAQARALVRLTRPFIGAISDNQDEIDKLGFALAETSRMIAKEFRLDWLQVYSLLPNLETSLTDIWDFCPAEFKPQQCSEEQMRYRQLTGQCNNVKNPDWGSALQPFTNLLRPAWADGIGRPRLDVEGAELPSARLVSAVMHRDALTHDHSITTMLIAWGQMIDHDMTLTADTRDPMTNMAPECCEERARTPVLPFTRRRRRRTPPHRNCYPIEILPDDPFFRRFNRRCMNFVRSRVGLRPSCRLGTRSAYNSVTSIIDGSFVYGSTVELGMELRTQKLGQLKTLPVFREYGLKPLLPPKTRDPDDGCIRPNRDVFCFLAGDNRVNEQLVLAVSHVIFLREHNRIAENLLALNPHWDDELVYQETRKIIVAAIQHITYNEFLPMVLGREVMTKYGLDLRKEGYWDGYDPQVNPTTSQEFIAAAFRFGHSLLPPTIERWSLSHHFIDSAPLHRLLRQPYDVYRPGYVDTFMMGLVNQFAHAMDEGVTDQVTNFLFREPDMPFGLDLAAVNIQRGRDHGVPGYTAYRELCGLPPVESWDDLLGSMRNETVYRYSTLFRSPHDIDLWSGGISEITPHGSLVGPTFACLIAHQFQASKYGDRFWYELGGMPSSFTPEQLQEIRKIKLSRLVCENGDHIKTVQIYPMVFSDTEINPRVPCSSLLATGMSFEPWRDMALPGAPVLALQHQQVIVEHDNLDYPSQYKVLVDVPPPHSHSPTHFSTEGNLTNLYKVSSPAKLGVNHLTDFPEIAEDALRVTVPDTRYLLVEQASQPKPTTFTKNNRRITTPRLPQVASSSKELPPVQPFPENQPFPSMDGLFSNNPGYLVKQKFKIYTNPPPPPQTNPWRVVG